ncbi:MAG: helix-turn-helix transcriptional regulator [Coriobacteriaceae bacterium]|nr:helix-turn-helix transcriptional regulator [Coriobacteriaceae bacterium]
MLLSSISSADDFGALIRKRRKELGYTQLELAEGVGVGATFISKLENGKGSSEFNRVLRVARMLGIDLFAQVRD